MHARKSTYWNSRFGQQFLLQRTRIPQSVTTHGFKDRQCKHYHTTGVSAVSCINLCCVCGETRTRLTCIFRRPMLLPVNQFPYRQRRANQPTTAGGIRHGAVIIATISKYSGPVAPQQTTLALCTTRLRAFAREDQPCPLIFERQASADRYYVMSGFRSKIRRRAQRHLAGLLVGTTKDGYRNEIRANSGKDWS
jgi:hypothetical protein